VTAADWVREKNLAAPAELRRAMLAAVEGAAGRNLTAQLSAASRAVAQRIAIHGCDDRSHALDLLTLDALLTGAMESGAANAASCEAVAGSLLAVISEAAAIE
jgi:hypothetical protein